MMNPVFGNRHIFNSVSLWAIACFGISILAAIPAYAADNTIGGLPSWANTVTSGTGGGGGNTKECIADFNAGVAWLDLTPRTKRYKELTSDIENKWDSYLPIEKFEVPGASPAEKLAAVEVRKKAKTAFLTSKANLLNMAIDVAISANRNCQDCILLDDWGYLIYLGQSKLFGYGLASLPTNPLSISLTHTTKPPVTTPPTAPTITSFKLSGATKNQMNAVKKLIARFRIYANVLDSSPKTAHDYPGLAKATCTAYPNWKIAASPNYAKCIQAVVAKCRAATTEEMVRNDCFDALIKEQVLQQEVLKNIVATLNATPAGGGKMSSDMDHTMCKAGTSKVHFKNIPFRGFALQ